MSTLDVPGHKPENKDTLAGGCWAEADDGSLVFVKGVEGGDVIYEVYDLGQTPVIMYPDHMPEGQFKAEFSYDGANTKWVWHDKTPFPWPKVISSLRAGGQYSSARDLITAAARIAVHRELRAQAIAPGDLDHLQDQVVEGVATRIMDRLTDALSKLPKGPD